MDSQKKQSRLARCFRGHKRALALLSLSSLAGLSVMGAGSYALFTATASTPITAFGAATVDLSASGGAFKATSGGSTIPLTTVLPGDSIGGTDYVYNRGNVTEYVSVQTGASGDIFFDDGLNNPAARGSNGSLLIAYVPTHQYLDGSGNPYGPGAGNNPVLSAPGTATTSSGTDWVSADYAKTNDNATYQFDNNPFAYSIDVTVQQSTDGGSTWSTATQYTTRDGTPLALNDTSTWQTWYQELGTSPATNAPYPATVAAYSATTQYSGPTKIFGIELPPSTVTTQTVSGASTIEFRLAVVWSGGLPLAAHNDYQQTVGTLAPVFDAWQYENATSSTGSGTSIGTEGPDISDATTSGSGTTSPVPGQTYTLTGVMEDSNGKPFFCGFTLIPVGGSYANGIGYDDTYPENPATGAFRVEDVPPGQYNISFHLQGYKLASPIPLVVTGNMSKVIIKLSNPTYTVSGQLDVANVLQSGSQLYISDVNGDVVGLGLTTNSEGDFAWPGLPNGTYTLYFGSFPEQNESAIPHVTFTIDGGNVNVGDVH